MLEITYDKGFIDDVSLKTTRIKNVRAIGLARINSLLNFHIMFGKNLQSGRYPIRCIVWCQRKTRNVEFACKLEI